MKARLSISRDLATLYPPCRWRWYILLTGPGQHNHIFMFDHEGQGSRVGAFLDFLANGLPWLIRAWRLP